MIPDTSFLPFFIIKLVNERGHLILVRPVFRIIFSLFKKY